MNRRLLSLVAAAVLVAVVSGCGKYADEGKAKGESAAGNSPAASTNSSGSGSGAAGSGASGANSPSVGSSSAGSSGGGGAATTGQPKAQQPAEKVKLGPLKVGEVAKVGPLTVTLKQTAVVDQAAGLPPGYVHLLTEVAVANEGGDPYTLNITDHFKVETPEAKKAPYNVQATANRNPRLQGSVEPGKSSAGWIGYLAKKVSGSYKFQFIHPDYGEATWEFGL